MLCIKIIFHAFVFSCCFYFFFQNLPLTFVSCADATGLDCRRWGEQRPRHRQQRNRDFGFRCSSTGRSGPVSVFTAVVRGLRRRSQVPRPAARRRRRRSRRRSVAAGGVGVGTGRSAERLMGGLRSVIVIDGRQLFVSRCAFWSPCVFSSRGFFVLTERPN